MSKIFGHVLLRKRGGVNLVEVIIAAAISVAAYFSFTSMYKYDHDNVVRMESKWLAQVVAEGVASTFSTMTPGFLMARMKAGDFKPDETYECDVDTTAAELQWLKTWVELSPRIYKITFQIKVYDKDDTENSKTDTGSDSCYEDVETFKMCHKEFTTEVFFNYKKNENLGIGVERSVKWKTWLSGQELPEYTWP